MNNTKLIVILGCTATGKTKLAVNLASKLNGEIISADSRQVYKGMDVGTGKDLAEFVVENQKIPYHLIDIVDAGTEYNVFEYQKDFITSYEDIVKREKQAILCGGSGLYLEAVLKGYRLPQIPENQLLRKELATKTTDELVHLLISFKIPHNSTDTVHRKRTIRAIEIAKYELEHRTMIQDFPKIKHQIFGVQFEREQLKERITERLKTRLKNEGMIEEVEGLLKAGITPDKLKYYGLEYKFITQFLLGEINRNELFEKLNIAIHQFSKRQATWFRKMEKNGFEINWIDGNLSLNEKVNLITKRLNE